MIVTTTELVPGRKVKDVLGMVQSNVEGARLSGAAVRRALKTVAAALFSWGPRIVTGREAGLPAASSLAARRRKKALAAAYTTGEYSETLFRLREAALRKLVKKAEKISADALVGVGFDVNVIFPQTFEVNAMGTAVRLMPPPAARGGKHTVAPAAGAPPASPGGLRVVA